MFLMLMFIESRKTEEVVVISEFDNQEISDFNEYNKEEI